MERWDADLLLHVIQFLNFRDAERLALMSRRCYYLVHHYRIALCGPQMVVGTKRNSYNCVDPPKSPFISEAVVAARDQCQSKPQLALSFESNRWSRYSGQCWTPALLPDNTVVLGAVSEYSIQVTLGPDNCDYNDDEAVMLLSGLSEEHTAMKPFCSSENDMDDIPFDDEGRQDWKLFIVYGADDVRAADALVKSLQARFPNALIVGGFCDSAYVSIPIDRSHTEEYYYNNFTSEALLKWISAMGGPMPPKEMVTKREIARHANALAHDGRLYRLAYVESGVCGVALAGNVPVRSVVSRGVRSFLATDDGLGDTEIYVHEARVYRPGDQDYTFEDGDLGAGHTYHLLSRFRHARGRVFSPYDLMRYIGGEPDFVGLRRLDQDGFTVVAVERYLGVDGFLVYDDDVESFVGYNLDLYRISGYFCRKDTDNCMIKLVEQTEHETILGALMFTCNRREPEYGHLLRGGMDDATRFANMFPKVPCLGFYTSGQIGPSALVGQQSGFQQGSAYVQGGAAVFVAPNIDRAHVHLDDGEASIEAFVRHRLGGTTDSNRNIH